MYRTVRMYNGSLPKYRGKVACCVPSFDDESKRWTAYLESGEVLENVRWASLVEMQVAVSYKNGVATPACICGRHLKEGK